MSKINYRTSTVLTHWINIYLIYTNVIYYFSNNNWAIFKKKDNKEDAKINGTPR